MKGVQDLYDAGFFSRHSDASEVSAHHVLPIIFDRFHPKSVIDVGCGAAGWAAVAERLGASKVVGIDGDHVPRHLLKIPSQQFLTADLEQDKMVFDVKFDLGICVEVAEHLSAIRGAGFVQNLTELSKVVLFSAAVPGQGGRGHVNEQWPSYWVSLFNHFGYVARDIVRPVVWGNQHVCPWYRQNCLVFEHGQSNDKNFAEYDVIHPDIWKAKIEWYRQNWPGA